MLSSSFLDFVTVLGSGAQRRVCSLLQPCDWLSLQKASPDTRDAVSPATIQVAIAEVLQQILIELSSARKLGENEFCRLAYALRLAVIQQPRGDGIHSVSSRALRPRAIEEVRSILRDLLECFNSRLGGLGEISIEDAEGQKTYRQLLRKMDLNRWIAAARAHPKLSHYFFHALCRWPLSFDDRDILLQEFEAATLLALADFDDRLQVLAALKFALNVTHDSQERVAFTEHVNFSAKAAEALQRYDEDVNIVVAALVYLLAVSNCPEHRPTLVQLGIELLCRNALQILPWHAEVREFAENIRSTLQ